ncbi:ParB N-terminal domain-containing protein [Nocardia sp. NBC_01499]|uniref:ParB/RepB/Spo0J family partition protein n=1 Tax=Nocardia sp. NBC_01499 TaxID=2903597 RepID=UPI00387052FD
MAENNFVYSSAGIERLCSARVDLPIANLLPSDSPPRTAGENSGHIRMLAESTTRFPPIVVHRPTKQVIDGVHRIRAAQLRGDTTISAVLFDGSTAEAFVLAVKLNAEHGLPLSLADRKTAALRILLSYPQWSDRAIAAVAGISPKTVAAIRTRSAEEIPQSTGRIARNGVLHRTDISQGRRRAAELFTADRTLSARAVAQAAGISVTTAKEVRKELRQGARWSGNDAAPTSDVVDNPTRTVGPDSAVQWASTADVLRQLRGDPSLRFTDAGRKLLRWLETPFDNGADWGSVVHNIPSHCAPSIAKLARQHSRGWQQLAYLLDQRSETESSA